MENLNLSKILDDCFEWELNDQVIRFDSIIDSLMSTDVPRSQFREELVDWQDDVANLVDEVSALGPYEGFRDFALMAEELVGAEV